MWRVSWATSANDNKFISRQIRHSYQCGLVVFVQTSWIVVRKFMIDWSSSSWTPEPRSTSCRTYSSIRNRSSTMSVWLGRGPSAHTHTHSHTHCWLISKSSFSRQCVGRIRDTCSQLTWKSHSPHTHGGTFWPTLTPAQTLYLHESCQNKPKSEVCKTATLPFHIRIASLRSHSLYMQPVDMTVQARLENKLLP